MTKQSNLSTDSITFIVRKTNRLHHSYRITENVNEYLILLLHECS
ncbi:Uncharacterized protein BM_BM14090 [Brugia malayi]|uniref:Bm14090 n=1 Tax=Brugia malayi TaxID=6279 RepID=A0A0K0J082_BRUMA|nr:Uncharacterized protein BM_BM14090 [Brugia malayi]CDP90672.1 Bm14090 [Brugia malayi]VIO87255.1 Uncharacterized protein BM_BM14090 [Brugia malayi]